MRGGDGGGVVSALEPHLVHTSAEPEPGRRRCARRSERREKAGLSQSSNHRVESHPDGRAKGPARNGISGNGAAASSSMRVEVPRTQRAGNGSRDRSSKRVRGQNRLGKGNAVANVFHQYDVAQGATRSAAAGEEAREDDVQRVGEYFPQIPDELGQQCLTRLSRHRIHKMAIVCKKWKEYLTSAELYKARRLLGVREDWVFILGQNIDKQWRAFIPAIEDWVVLPHCPSDITFDHCDKESMVAGLNLLVLGQAFDGYIIWKFDTIKSSWSPTPRMHFDRCMFGSAAFDKYAYFAGGTNKGNVLKSVERYNSETNSWELLAEMNLDRKACSGFVMDGKFYVIGGHVSNNMIWSSGEMYDPQANTWTLIERMWPQEFVPSTNVSPPLVAVLNNRLYAINITQNMLMTYDKEENTWQNLEQVPYRAENGSGWGLGFKAVGDELFVIGGARASGQFLPQIHAYRPRMDGGETWRLVTDLKIPTNGFIYNCAVMSG